MTRVEISKARKLKKKDFNRNYLKKYCKFLGYTTLVILGAIAWIHLLVGAVNQQANKVNLIMNNEYIEPDFQDSWKTKKPARQR